ncbi:MAG: MarR family transcriptional regulator [Chloroflexi bacterium]|nr:MarR family transcriptional regulator [Chloroflexota bacterium]
MLTICTALNLRKASRVVTKLFDDVLRPIGLRSTQLPILVTLRLLGPTTMRQLSAELAMSPTTLTRNLRPLVKRGMVQVLAGDDRRTREISLAEEGRKLLEEAVPLWEKAQGFTVESLGRDRWRNLITELSAAVEVVQAQ